jgi:hypothetical protein
MSRYSLVNEEGKGWDRVPRLPRIRLIASCGSLLAIVLFFACDLGPRGPVLNLPSRPDDAQTGAEIVRDIRSLDLEAREERIL